MSDQYQIGIKLTVDGKTAKAELAGVQGQLNQVGQSANKATGEFRQAGTAAQSFNQHLNTIGVTAGRVAGAFAAITAVQLGRFIVSTATEFDRLNASLKTVTGSVANAGAAMGMIKQFAASTPYEVDQITEAFIRLRSLGLDATEKSLRSYGNTASAMGKPIMQFVEALADATTGEFERLKEFGIKTRVAGDQVAFTFQGMTTVIRNSADEISDYLQRIGNEKFADGMSAQMDTLGGRLSNLSDAFSNLADTIANLGVRSSLKMVFSGVTDVIDDLTKRLATLTGQQGLTGIATDLEAGISRLENRQRAGILSDRQAEELKNMREQLALIPKAGDEVGKAADTMAFKIENVGKVTDDTMAAIAASARKYGVPEALALAVGKQESGFNQSAVSKQGARGIMQLMPAKASELGVDASNAMQNIEGGVKFLSDLIKRFDGNLKLVLAAYNAGEGAVKRYGGQVPPYAETQDYVVKVTALYQGFLQKYPGGLPTISAEATQKELTAAQKSYESALTSIEVATKARADAAQASLDTRIQQLDAQMAQARAGAKGGNLAEIEAAAEKEKQILREIAGIRAQKAAIDENTARIHLANINAEIAAADKFNLTEIDRQRLQDQRVQAESQLSILSQQRAQAEIAAGQQVASIDNQVLAAREAEVQKTQEATQARADYIAQIDSQIIALQTGNDALTEEAQLRKLSADMGQQEADAWQEAAKAKLAELNAAKKAADQRKQSEQSVREEQLRLNAVFEDGVKQAQLFAKNMVSAFGKVGEGIGNAVVSMAEFAQQQYQVQRNMQDALEKAGDNPEKQAEIRMRAAEKSAQYEVALFGDITQAAQSYFNEGTKGYAALSNATKVFRMVEMALALKSSITQIAAGMGWTTQAVAQSTVRGTALAAEGVANQAQGDPYSAIPRMVAMAGIMAALGFAVAGFSGGSGGSSSGAVAKTTRKDQTGTVFGDPEAQSNSIANSLEILKNNSSTDLSYSAKMVRSLQNIEYAMAGVTNTVIRNVNALSGIGSNRVPGAPAPFDPLMGALGLLTSSRKISDYGIGQLVAQSLNDILAQGFQGQAFTDITTKVKTFGITLSSYTKTYISNLDQGVEDEFTKVIRGIADSIKAAGEAFGISGDEFIKRVGDFKIKFDTTSLKGLKGDELQNAIQAQFSKIADQLSAALNIQGLEEFQRVGEGMFETLIRVADGINTSRAQLEALNIQAVQYSDILYKQGDVAAEIVRQSIVAFEGIGSSIGQFMNEAVGSASDLIETYQDLVSIRDQMKGAHLDWQSLTRAMTEAAGGVKALRDAMASFSSNFLSAGEQYGQSMVTLGREFAALGFAIPASKDAFRALVESIDTSTESGQKLFARLIALSDAFAQAADQADALEKKYQSYTDPFAAFKDRINTVIQDFQDILDARLGLIEATFENRGARLKAKAAKPYQDIIGRLQGISGTRQGEIAADFGYIAQAQGRINELNGMIQRAIASGNAKLAPLVHQWQGQVKSLTDMIGTLNADIAAKQTEVNSINAEIKRLTDEMNAGATGIDADIAAKQIKALNKERRRILREQGAALVQTMKDIWDEMISAIDAAQKSLRRQIAELRGPKAVLRLAESNLSEAKHDLRQYRRSGENNPQKAIQLIQDAQQAVMDRYNAKLARIQERIQKKTDAINAAVEKTFTAIDTSTQLWVDNINETTQATIDSINEKTQAEIDALNEATQAKIDAINEELDKKIQAQQKIDDAAMKVLTDQLDAVRKLQEAYKQIAQYAQQLKIGNYSPLSPEDKLREAQRQYNELLLKAQAGDADAAAKLTGAADAYLAEAKNYFASGPQYAEIFSGVQKALEFIGGQKTTDPDSIQSKIDALKESQEANMKALRDSVKDQIKAVQKSAEDQQKAIQKAAQDQIKAVQKGADAQIKAIQDAAEAHKQEIRAAADKQIADLSDPDKNRALKKLTDETIKELKHLSNLLDDERQKAADAAKQQLDYLESLNVLSKRQLKQLRHIANKMGAGEVPELARGGLAMPGLALVGEQGPELVRFNSPATVYPASTTASILSGSSKEGLEEVKVELQALVRTQSGANPRMVAALEHIEQRISTIERHVRLAA